MIGAGGKLRHKILVSNGKMIAPEPPEPLKNRSTAIDGGIMADAQFEILEIAFARLVPQFLLRGAIGLAVFFMPFAQHFTVRINPVSVMIEKGFTRQHITLPGQRRYVVQL